MVRDRAALVDPDGPGAEPAVPSIGLRRVDWVRVIVGEGRLRAEAVGSGFRLPVCSPIPVAVAGRLIAAGVPVVATRSRQSDGQGSWR